MWACGSLFCCMKCFSKKVLALLIRRLDRRPSLRRSICIRLSNYGLCRWFAAGSRDLSVYFNRQLKLINCSWFASESWDLRQSQMYFNRQHKLIGSLHGSLCAGQGTDTNTMLPFMASSDFVCVVHGQAILLMYIEHAD